MIRQTAPILIYVAHCTDAQFSTLGLTKANHNEYDNAEMRESEHVQDLALHRSSEAQLLRTNNVRYAHGRHENLPVAVMKQRHLFYSSSYHHIQS